MSIYLISSSSKAKYKKKINMMTKMLIVPMQGQEYPFNLQHSLPNPPPKSITIRQILPLHPGNRQNLVTKATFIKNLRNRNLVRIDSLLEEETTLHVLYEYVQGKEDWLDDDSIVGPVLAQLKSFVKYLCNIGVRADMDMNKIGVTDNHTLKYFIGLDFIWDSDPNQEALEQYYDEELSRLFGDRMEEKTEEFQEQQLALCPYPTTPVKRDPHDRKVSFATLPSRYNRLMKIDKQLSHIKSTGKGQQATQVIESIMVQQDNEETVIPSSSSMKYPSLQKVTKRHEMRKYSGDARIAVLSKNKLHTKESDIRSEFGGRAKKHVMMEANREEVSTINTKTRIEEMKYREYQQITKIDKNYLKEFMSVLEDDQPSLPPQLAIQPQRKPDTHAGTVVLWRDANMLQNKARQAINNSLKAIKKFKSLNKI